MLIFEDPHWADPSLLEFIEHLVDWVTGVPMFVVCTARPELYDKHPNWGGGKRNITVVSLSPLNDSDRAADLLSASFSPTGDSVAATEPLLKARATFERLGALPLLNEADIYLRDTQTSTG